MKKSIAYLGVFVALLLMSVGQLLAFQPPPPPRPGAGVATPTVQAAAPLVNSGTNQPPPPPRPGVVTTPEVVSTPVVDADIRLVYSADGVTLINISGKPVWLAGLLFRGEAGEFPVERWTQSSPVNIEAFAAGSCLQIRLSATLEAPEGCTKIEGWVSSQNPQLQFWMGDFEVTSYYNRITMCSAAAGICEFKLLST